MDDRAEWTGNLLANARKKQDSMRDEVRALFKRIESGEDAANLTERIRNLNNGIERMEGEIKELNRLVIEEIRNSGAMLECGADSPNGPQFVPASSLGNPGGGVPRKSVSPFVADAVGKMRRTAGERKAFGVSGSVAVPVELLGGKIAAKPRAMRYVSQLLGVPTKCETGSFSYLRQTTRTNNAAPVAVGGLKPTSAYGLERITSDLTTIAHLSDPIPRQFIEDQADLQTFIEAEMLGGILAALDAQILSGSGVSPDLRGILNTAGIQSQAFTSNKLDTARRALTLLQTAGVIGDTDETGGLAFVLHPSDWEFVESVRTADGEYLGGGPVDSTARSLWGVPVVVSTSVAANTGILGYWPAAYLASRGPIDIAWSENVSDDFERNQVRWRVEGRFGLAVTAPSAFVSIALA